MKASHLFFLCLILVLPFSNAQAYVENIVHGYMNCMACHHSPSGGGILNDYGRSLSRELMSTWKGPAGIEKPLFGLLPNKESVHYGGHFRAIQTKQKNDQFERARLFAMQQNIELAVRTKRVWVVATAGTQEGPKGIPGKDDFISERHYLLWENSEDERVRVGKFRQNYGLNDSNHSRFTKSALGFGSLTESYQLEFNKYFETGELVASSALGTNFFSTDSRNKARDEKNLMLGYSYYLGEASKVGINTLIGEFSDRKRFLAGIHGVVRIFNHLFTKFELNYEYSKTIEEEPQKNGLYTGHLALGYQLAKGLTTTVFHEQLQRDLSNHETLTHAPGVGIQWLPFPHFELQLEYKREFYENRALQTTDKSWLLFHFYL